MPDYQNNPTFDSDIRKIQGPSPAVTFNYEWNDEDSKWVPAGKQEISIGDVSLSLDNTDKILSGISGVLEEQGQTNDSETHRVLSGISGVLEQQGQTNDEETHRVLLGISGVLEEKGETSDEETHRILSGISGELTLDSEETHRILSGVSGELSFDFGETHLKLTEVKQAIEELEVEINVDNVEIDLVETNRILSGISGQDSTHYNENETYLNGISGQDQIHYIENERLLKSIKDNAENISLSVEELKNNFTDITYHTKRFGEKQDPSFNIEMENTAPIEKVRKPFTEILYDCVDEDETLDRENVYINKTKSILAESYPEDDDIERIGDHDESSPFLFKSEGYTGSLDGFHKFTPIAKPMGANDRLTVFNDNKVPLEILFRGGEAMKLYGGYSMELTKSEAYKMFVRKKYALNGFSLGYTLERMYTPEQTLFNDIEEHPETLPENTHQLLTIGNFMTDERYLYVSYGNQVKKVAIASWEKVFRTRSMVYPIDYYDAYTDQSYLYLKFQNHSRRVAISDWEGTSEIPIDAHNKVWADEYFIYIKIHGPKNHVGGFGGKDEWRRYAIAQH